MFFLEIRAPRIQCVYVYANSSVQESEIACVPLRAEKLELVQAVQSVRAPASPPACARNAHLISLSCILKNFKFNSYNLSLKIRDFTFLQVHIRPVFLAKWGSAKHLPHRVSI